VRRKGEIRKRDIVLIDVTPDIPNKVISLESPERFVAEVTRVINSTFVEAKILHSSCRKGGTRKVHKRRVRVLVKRNGKPCTPNVRCVRNSPHDMEI
jgi:hypothetical protein